MERSHLHEPASITSNAYSVSQNIQQVCNAHRCQSILQAPFVRPNFNPPMIYPAPAAVPASLHHSEGGSAVSNSTQSWPLIQPGQMNRLYRRIGPTDERGRQPDLFLYNTSSNASNGDNADTFCGLGMELPANFAPEAIWRLVVANISAHVENDLAVIQASMPDLSSLLCPCPTGECCSGGSCSCDGGCAI